MISKRSRKNVSPVENFKQAGFNGSKGIDVNASAEDPSKVLLSKNLDIEPDGSLVLRKPVVIRRTLPEVSIGGVVIKTDVIHAAYMYDNKHVLIVRKAADGTQYVGIFEENSSKTFQITINSWDTGDEHVLYPYENYTDSYIHIPYLDFTKLSLVNSATSTFLTGISVNIMDSSFKLADKTYPHSDQTELFYPNLYDYIFDAWKYRTLTISAPAYIPTDFNIRILTPEIPTIESSEELSLNANLDADNPYAIRDVYDTTAPTVKAILPYVQSVDKGTHTEYIANFSEESDTFTDTKDIFTSAADISSSDVLDTISFLQVISGSGNTVFSKDGYIDLLLKLSDNKFPSGAVAGTSYKTYNLRPHQIVSVSLKTYTYSGGFEEQEHLVLRVKAFAKDNSYREADVRFKLSHPAIQTYNTDTQGCIESIIFRLPYTVVNFETISNMSSDVQKAIEYCTGNLLSTYLANRFQDKIYVYSNGDVASPIYSNTFTDGSRVEVWVKQLPEIRYRATSTPMYLYGLCFTGQLNYIYNDSSFKNVVSAEAVLHGANIYVHSTERYVIAYH